MPIPGVIENSSVSLLIKVSTCVGHQTIEAPSFFLCDLRSGLLPLSAEVNRVSSELCEMNVKVFPGYDLIPKRFGEWAK